MHWQTCLKNEWKNCCITNKEKTAKNEWQNDGWVLFYTCCLTCLSKDTSVLLKVIYIWTSE